MSNRVLLKKSSVSAKVPLSTDLEYGEVALNYQDGKLYFKTAGNNVEHFDSRTIVAQKKQEYTATASQTTFTVTGGYVLTTVQVFANGIALAYSDYTATNGTTVVLTDPRVAGDNIIIWFGGPASGGANGSFTQIDRKSYIATSGQTTFNVTYAGAYVDVYINGSHLNLLDYTATSGTNIVLNSGATVNDEIDLVGYYGTVVSSSVINNGDVLIYNGTTKIWDSLAPSAITTASAAKWSTARTLSYTGDATGSMSVDGSTNVSAALTLATVNSNVGAFGSTTASPIITVNAKGLVTAVSTSTITPAIGSITGLGTGVATALGVNTGTAGAFVVNGDALGTPASGVMTNVTGTAAGLTAGNVTTNANLTGVITSTGNATAIADAALSIAKTSGLQAAIDLKQNLSSKDAANGYAGLDSSSKINPSQLPALAITDTFVVASQAAQIALTAEVGDVAIRTDLSKSFILQTSPSSTFANWQELLTPTDSVSSVFGRTGVVTAQNGDYTAAQVGAPAGSGNSTGTNTGDQTNISGNAATVTTNANLTGPVTSVGNATSFTSGMTIPAFTLGGTVSGGGNQINNVVIGTTTPLAGAFTTLSSTLDATIQGVTVGRGAGAVATNMAVGATALNANTSGQYNVCVGPQTGFTNTSGYGNTFMGSRSNYSKTAGYSNVDGYYNTAVGASSLAYNTSGFLNAAFGMQTLLLNTTGVYNTAIGSSALTSNDSGANNTAVGYSALALNTTASNNTAVGYQAGYSNTTGAQNTAVGYQALNANVTGNYNAAFGDRALRLATGSNNASFGGLSSYSNTTGSFNTAIGNEALYNNTTASNNTAVGYGAAYSNTTGTLNTALGQSSLYWNITGGSNVAVGLQALFSNTTASNNTAVGYQAGYSNTTGTNNVAFGKDALNLNTTNSNNTAVGTGAGKASTGSSNTFIGSDAGETTTTGTFNTFLGRTSGYLVTTGGKNTILGTYSGNQGGLDIRTASNYIVLSDGDGNPRVVVNGSGNLGIGTTSASQKLSVAGNALIGTEGGTRIAIAGAGGTDSISEYYNAESIPRWSIGRDLYAGGMGGIGFGAVNGGTIAAQGAAIGIPAARTLGFATGNGTALTERMRIDSSGNVGIGTSSPGAKLDVAGTTIFRGSTRIDGGVSGNVDGNLTINAIGSAVYSNLYFSAAGVTGPSFTSHTDTLFSFAYIYHVSPKGFGGSWAVESDGYNPIVNIPFVTGIRDYWQLEGGTSGSNLVTLKALGSDTNISMSIQPKGTGNVGIGVTAPTYKIHVDTTVAATTGVQNVAMFQVQSSGSTDSTFGARLLLGTENPNGNVWPAGIAALNDSAGSNLSSLGFYTATSGPTLNECMRITSAGNVGIGTTSPSQRLHVANSAADPYILVGGNGRDCGLLLNASTQFTALRADGANRLYVSSGAGEIIFTANGSERARIDTVGNVGIGTTSPATKLNIENAGACQLQMAYSSTIFGRVGRLSSGDYEFSSYENGGNLLFGTTTSNGSTTERARIDSSGNVGIGTSSPSSNQGLVLQLGTQNLGSNPKLKIAGYHDLGNLYVGQGPNTGEMGFTTNTHGRISNGDYAPPDNITSSVSSWSVMMSGATLSANDYFRIRRAPPLSSSITPTFVDLLSISAQGNVGIGTTTMTRVFNISGTNPGTGLNINNTGTSGRSFSIFSTNSSASVAGVLGFYDDTAGAYRMVIDSSGNVGINTATPNGLLTINNNSADGTSDYTKGIVFTDNTNGSGPWTHAGIWTIGSTGYNGNLIFGTDGDATNNTAGITEKMRITSAGNVGIGTSSPAYKLDVKGNIRSGLASTTTGEIAFFSASNDSQMGLLNNATEFKIYSTYATTAGYKPINFYTSDALKMTLDASGNLGIGTTTPGTYGKLDIYQATDPGTTPAALSVRLQGVGGGSGAQYGINVDASQSYNNSVPLYGIKSVASQNTGQTTYGVHSTVNPGNSNTPRFGVYGKAGFNSDAVHGLTNSTLPVGVYGEATNAVGTTNISTSAAGYFLNSSTLGAESYGVYIKTTAGPTSIIPLRIDHGSSEIARFTTTGLGIGTTSPGAKLNIRDTGANISGGNAIYGTSMKGIMVDNASNGDESVGIWFNTGPNSHWSGISGQRTSSATNWGTHLSFYTHEDATVDLTYTRERMRISSAGNVGIGTSSPTAKLQVFAGGIVARFGAYGTTTYDDIELQSYAGYNQIGTRTTTPLSIATNGTGRINITGAGSVGITEGSPFTLLQVGARTGAGTTNPNTGSVLSVSKDGATGIDLGANVNANAVVGAINWINYYGVGNYNTARIDNYADGNSNSGTLRFWTASVSSSPTERMRITSDGNVGIGTSSPSSRLSVAGNITLTAASPTISTALNDYLDIKATHAGGAVRIYSGNSLAIECNSAQVITMPNLAGAGTRAVNANASGTLSAASDSRLKQEVEGQTLPGLAEIMEIEVKAYKWLDDINVRGADAAIEIGFFADQVAPIIPSAAPMGRDGYYGFYDRSVVAALVNAIKEQQALITQLTNRITALEGA